MKASDHFLNRFFYPESIAIVGATNNPANLNTPLMKNLVRLGFRGKLYPINPKENEIMGLKAFPNLQSVPNQVDLVVTAVPATRTQEIIKGCDEIGVRNIVIISGGFSEGGSDGQKLHQDLRSFFKEKGIRALGPNTLSPINTSENLAISYHALKSLRKGNLSLAFQSGFYEPKLSWIFSHLGINKILDMGNKMNINEVDALEYFALDASTEIIAMHIESLHGNGRDFFNILKQVSLEKPTIILKSGRTQSGSRAASSHTGSLAGENNLIFDSMLRQTAAIQAHSIEEFFDFAKVFQYVELPKGNRMALIPYSGGEGVMATDACEINGFKMANLSKQGEQQVRKIAPPWEGSSLNPFDAGFCFQFFFTNLSFFFKTLAVIPKDENVDCTVMQLPPPWLYNSIIPMTEGLGDEYIDIMLAMNDESGKPFALWCTTMDAREMEFVQRIEAHNIPVFPSSIRAIKSLAALYRYSIRHK